MPDCSVLLLLPWCLFVSKKAKRQDSHDAVELRVSSIAVDLFTNNVLVTLLHQYLYHVGGLTINNFLLQKKIGNDFVDVEKISVSGGVYKIRLNYNVQSVLAGISPYHVVLTILAQGTVSFFGMKVTSTQTLACPSNMQW